MATLSIRKLDVRLGGRSILAGLDLEVGEGEFLVLLGPSGCGKSTLLHAIAGLQEVAAGQVLIDGEDHTHSEPKARNVGMVFQSYALYPNMDVAGNLGFGLRARGVPEPEVAERVGKAAAMLQLEPLLARRPAQLSGGQRQRVAIGRALVRDARLFLLDEPFSNLDAGLRATLRRELRLLHQRLGATMIHVTHDQVEAMTLATRIAIMHQGRIEQVGTPDEVYGRPANRYVAAFLGSPGMDFIDGRLTAGGSAAARWRFESPALSLDLPDARLAAAAPGALAEGRAATLGLRPEQLRLVATGSPGADCEGTVTLIEPHGGHRVVWLECAGSTLAVLDHSPTPGPGLVPGERVGIDCGSAAVLLFDPVTGQRL